MRRRAPGRPTAAPWLLAAAICAAFPSPRAAAQIESALLSKVSFNVTSPGGKSLAMGGAFTAIADDATTALANPAGLGLLSSWEGGISYKSFGDTLTLTTARSTATGALTAPYPAVEPSTSTLSSSLSSVEFAGAVMPISSRFVAAVVYAENLRFRGEPGASGYSYIELRDNRSGGQTRRDFLYEYREFGGVSLSSRLLALSAGFRASERVRVGAGLTLSRIQLSLDGDGSGPHRIVNRTFVSAVEVETRTQNLSIRGFDGDVPGFVLGVHADLTADGMLTAGAAFRLTGRAHGTLVLSGDVPAGIPLERELSFTVPRDAAVGVAAHPMDGLTIAAEAQWIDYEKAFSPALPVESYSGLAGPPPGVPVDGAIAALGSPDSVVVPRIGFEYVAVQGAFRMAFRVGYHREPAHGVTSDLSVADSSGTRYGITDPPFSESVRTVFDGGRADDRFSGGLGVTLGSSLSLDLAFDLGRESRRLAASLFYRF